MEFFEDKKGKRGKIFRTFTISWRAGYLAYVPLSEIIFL
jgi:hypothetical protein